MRALGLAVCMVWALFLALSGCAAKRPSTATVPASAPSLPASLAGASGSGSEAPEPSKGQGSGEVALQYERVVVPPLQPGTPVSEDPPQPGSRQPNAVAPVRTPPRRPTATPSQRIAETEANPEPDAGKPSEIRPPSLKPMLSDAERRSLDVQITTNLDRARRNLAMIRGGRLGANEKSALDEARSFAVRAEQLRLSDPTLANSLAERAAILTQELLRKQ